MGLPAQYFRTGAGSVIVNGAGLVLALERADVPGAWQLPQGGLDAAEDPLRAACREVFEETRIPASDLELLDSFPDPLAYELPAGLRSRKTGRGQVQYWFLFRFNGSDDRIDVAAGGEFRAWKWLRFQTLLASAAEFRKPVYERLAQRFARYLGSSRRVANPAAVCDLGSSGGSDVARTKDEMTGEAYASTRRQPRRRPRK